MDIQMCYDQLLKRIEDVLHREWPDSTKQVLLDLDSCELKLRSWWLDLQESCPHHEIEHDAKDTQALLECLNRLLVMVTDLQQTLSTESGQGQAQDVGDNSSTTIKTIMSEFVTMSRIQACISTELTAASRTNTDISKHADSISVQQSDFDLADGIMELDEPDITELLLTENRTNVRDVLLRAAKYNHPETLRILLSDRTWEDVSVILDDDGLTLLQVAANEGNLPIVELLLHQAHQSQRVQKQLCASDEPELIDDAYHDQHTLEQAMENRWTPLHYACAHGTHECIMQILHTKPSTEVRDRNGHTALDVAALNHRQDVVTLLVKSQAHGFYLDNHDISSVYVYFPLRTASSSIRVLRLHPGARKSPLTCSFDIVHLNEHGQEGTFDALSYGWSSVRSQQSSIRVFTDGKSARTQQIEIQPNLEEALIAIRDPHVSRSLWVDALCINQLDAVEMNTQIALMGTIYRRASRTIAWVGREDEASKTCMNCMKEMVHRVEDKLDFHDTVKILLALNRFMKRSWFQRVWTIQEVVLSKRVIILSGPDAVAWSDFESLFRRLLDPNLGLDIVQQAARRSEIYLLSDETYMLSQLRRLDATRLMQIVGTKSLGNKAGAFMSQASLAELVIACMTFRANDPRDKIFSLLGIASDCEFRSDVFRTNYEEYTAAMAERMMQGHFKYGDLELDYGKPTADVFQHFSMHAIKKSKSLNVVLWSCDCAIAQESLPSWCADWTGPQHVWHNPHKETRCIRWRGSQDDPILCRPLGYEKAATVFRASGSHGLDLRRTYWRQIDRMFSLFVEGFVYDKIAYAFDIPTDHEIPLRSWSDAAGIDDNAEVRNGVALRYWRTLMARSRSDEHMLPDLRHGDLVTAILAAGPNVIDESASSGVYQRLYSRIWMNTRRRKLVRTERKGAFALVNMQAQAGDLVCIVHGCHVPLILRRSSRSLLDVNRICSETFDARQLRIELATKRIKSFIAKRRKNGYTWPRPRAQAGRSVSNIGLTLCLLNMSVDTMMSFFSQNDSLSRSWRTSTRSLLDATLLLLNICTITSAVLYAMLSTYTINLEAHLRPEGWTFRVDRQALPHARPDLSLPWWPPSRYNTALIISLCALLHVAHPSAIRFLTHALAIWAWLLPPFTASHKKREHILDEEPWTKDLTCYYSLVGESYVDKIMHGEALKWQSAHSVPTTIFEIR